MDNDIERLAEDINNRIDYYRKEYKLTYAETIGILEIIKIDLYMENIESEPTQ